MNHQTPGSEKHLLPCWMLAAVVLFSISMIPSEMFGMILIPWQALSFTFSMIPVIAFFAYILDCRKEEKRATFRGYWEMLRVVKQAKRNGYQQTADRLVPGDAPRIMVAILAWLLVTFTWLAGNWSRVAGIVGI
jgi:hypothetical protein